MKNYPVPGVQLHYLSPLRKWRLLSLKELWRLGGYEATYKSFTKMLLRLEKKKVIEGIQEPFTRRKYVHLTRFGNDLLGGSKSLPCVSRETFIHDAKVVEFVLEAMRLPCFYGFELEHEIAEQIRFKPNYKVFPDAILLGELDHKKFRMAVELELTQKTKAKYLAKVGQYLESEFYDYVLYIFQSRGVLESYKKTIGTEFGAASSRKIIFGLNESILCRDFDFTETKVLFNGKEGVFNELFT